MELKIALLRIITKLVVFGAVSEFAFCFSFKRKPSLLLGKISIENTNLMQCIQKQHHIWHFSINYCFSWFTISLISQCITQPLCVLLWGRRVGEFRNLREMSEERGGKGEAPMPGLWELSLASLCSSVLPRKISGCSEALWGSTDHTVPYVLSQLLLTPASGLIEQPSHRLAPLRAVFSLLDRSFLLQ